jgi:hypothetical protein
VFNREPAANQRKGANLLELRRVGEAAVDFFSIAGDHLGMA